MCWLSFKNIWTKNTPAVITSYPSPTTMLPKQRTETLAALYSQPKKHVKRKVGRNDRTKQLYAEIGELALLWSFDSHLRTFILNPSLSPVFWQKHPSHWQRVNHDCLIQNKHNLDEPPTEEKIEIAIKHMKPRKSQDQTGSQKKYTNTRAVTRTIIGAVYIHIFVLCPDGFLLKTIANNA